jgi:hypothetical protein
MRLAKRESTASPVKLTATDVAGLALTTIVVLAMCGFILG